MEDTIFARIITGEIPSHKVYEDDRTLAFLDIHGSAPGHTLVIPKTHVDHLWDLPDEDYQAVMAACKKIASRLREVLQPSRVGVKVMGEEVPHAHVHLIPFHNIDEYLHSPDPDLEPDHAALAALADRLAF